MYTEERKAPLFTNETTAHLQDYNTNIFSAFTKTTPRMHTSSDPYFWGRKRVQADIL